MNIAFPSFALDNQSIINNDSIIKLPDREK